MPATRRVIVSVLVAGAIGALPACTRYRAARVDAVARDRTSGTVYFAEIRSGRRVAVDGADDEIASDDEVTAVIACNARTPEVCVRVLPESMSASELRAWSEQLNRTLALEGAEEPE